MKASFIKQTAINYGLSNETVRHIYKLYWPDNFYKKLEQITNIINGEQNGASSEQHQKELADADYINGNYCKRCSYDGNQTRYPSPCTGCGGYGERHNFVLKN